MGVVMADTVNLPAIGPVKKQWVWAGGALVVGIVGYAWWVRGRDSGGVTEVELEPEAGGGPAPSPTPGGTVDTTGGDQITTNQQWSDAVVKALSNVGYEPGFVATALGKYLGQRPLTPDEEDVVRTAWALVGRPPAGNFPIEAAPEPKPEPEDETPDRPTNLKAISLTRSTVSLAWDNMPGAVAYEIRRSKGKPKYYPKEVGAWVRWPDNSYVTKTALRSKTAYSYQVRSIGKNGKKSSAATVSVRTE